MGRNLNPGYFVSKGEAQTSPKSHDFGVGSEDHLSPERKQVVFMANLKNSIAMGLAFFDT
jgi:hypothetical protein